jgi:hypothetical protein
MDAPFIGAIMSVKVSKDRVSEAVLDSAFALMYVEEGGGRRRKEEGRGRRRKEEEGGASSF